MRTKDRTPQLLVEFQYNPGQLTDRRAVNYSTLEAPGRILPERQYSHGGDRTITFKVNIEGVHPDPGHEDIARDDQGGITPELNKYRAFVYPNTTQDYLTAGPSFLHLYTDMNTFVPPPICQLGFGENQIVDCLVTEVSISETKFNEHLVPLRAEVSLTLVELSPYPIASQGASSGGT